MSISSLAMKANTSHLIPPVPRGRDRGTECPRAMRFQWLTLETAACAVRTLELHPTSLCQCKPSQGDARSTHSCPWLHQASLPAPTSFLCSWKHKGIQRLPFSASAQHGKRLPPRWIWAHRCLWGSAESSRGLHSKTERKAREAHLGCEGFLTAGLAICGLIRLREE